MYFDIFINQKLWWLLFYNPCSCVFIIGFFELQKQEEALLNYIVWLMPMVGIAAMYDRRYDWFSKVLIDADGVKGLLGNKVWFSADWESLYIREITIKYHKIHPKFWVFSKTSDSADCFKWGTPYHNRDRGKQLYLKSNKKIEKLLEECYFNKQLH